jgi:thiamine biosynthesis protein ThiS
MKSLLITVNGQPREVPEGTSVKALIELLGLAGKTVAVERNLDVIPRAVHSTTELTAGDRLELVAFVGGG